ncbi:MAG: FAD-dependent monooxygenase [Chloroflexota bacterium]
MNNFEPDVLIVGAGPTGLALANALARLGTSFEMIEARETTSVHTKATNLMPGTLEQLNLLGLTDRMYETGGVMARYMIHMYGSNVGPRSMHLDESPHPNVLFLGQNLIDRNLKESLPNKGKEIRFLTRLIELKQDTHGVTAILQNRDNTQEEKRYKYVIGCDGPRSTTRRFSNCDFEPVKTGKYVWQADAKLSWKSLKTMKQMWLYYYDEGFGAVIHLPGDLTKVMVFEERSRLPARQPTLEEMEQKLREMSGDETAALTDLVWLSHGELLTGVAPTLIDGRILVAGDACNPILPNGGQGLNVGIQDAINLAWKLHDVVQGNASAALLNTYNTERRANRLALETVQINTLKYTLPAPALNRFVLRHFGNLILNRFWPLLAKAFSQLGLSYDKSPLTLEMLGNKGIHAGHRVLDADVLRASDDKEVSLFQELCVPEWKLIYFDDSRQGKDLSRLNDLRRPWVRKMVVSAAFNAPIDNCHFYYDVERVAHQVYQIKAPTLLLIRPDNYIAARVPADAINQIENHIAKWYPET